MGDGGVLTLTKNRAYAKSMIKKYVPLIALVGAGSYLAGRYDLWWVAVIYSGALYWFFFIKK